MSFPNETVEKLKSKVSLRLVDSFGAAIADLKFQVRTAQNKILAKGATDAEGKIPTFVADLGALLTLHVQRFGTEEMKLVKTLVPWSEDFRFKIVSAKRKDKVLPQAHEGSPGPYQRKTYTVKERDTLSEIAVAHRTTAAALASLNGIEVNDIIRIGQVLKVPNDPDSQPAAASAEAPSAPQPAPPPATPAAEPPPSKNEDADSAETESSAHPDKDEIPASTPAVTPPSKDASAAATGEAAPEKAKTAPNTAPIKTTTQDSRGANGTPKTSVKPTCDQTGCIKKGDKGLIVEELNIRLMGFGNTISAPAGLDQFTSATEKAVSQFQRDYMGVAETGKACRAVLAALDEFAKKFPIVFNEFLCQCRSSKPSPSHPCTGFGLARSDSDSIGYKKDGKNVRGVERPGIHRALFWSVRAARFYMSTVGRQLGYKFWHVSSGYRCWERARQMKSYTTNHMGNAVDIQFANTSDGSKVAGEARMEAIRDKVFVPKLGANVNWDTPNCISIEPIRTVRNKDGKVKVSGTDTWIHMDVREFSPAYLADRFYAKTADAAEGQAMLDMAKKEGRFALINCGGGSIPAGQPASASAPAPAPAPKPTSKPQPARPMPAAPPALPPVVLPKDASRPDCGERPVKGPPSEKRKPANTLAVSQLGLDFIRVWESGSLTEHHFEPKDDNRGFCTIGVGHLIDGKNSCATLKKRGSQLYKAFEAKINAEQEDALFAKDVRRIVSAILPTIHVPLHQHEFDALVSLAYNTGGLSKFNKLLAALNLGEYAKCCHEFEDITNHNDEGLVKRRKAEMAVFTNNLYDARH